MPNGLTDYFGLPHFQSSQTQAPHGASMIEYQPYDTNSIGLAGSSRYTYHQSSSREADGGFDDLYPSTFLNLDGNLQRSVPRAVAGSVGPLSSAGQQLPDDDIDLGSEEVDDEDLLALIVDERYAPQ